MATRQQTAERKISLRAELMKAGHRSDLPLPSVRELAARHSLSNRIVHLELKKLSHAGVVYTIPRVGTFLSAPTDKAMTPASTPVHSDVITVLAGDNSLAQPRHNEPGWADHMAWGALLEIRRQRRHALVLDFTRLLDEGIEALEDVPRGIVACTYGEQEQGLQKLLSEFVRRGSQVVVFGEEIEGNRWDRVVSDHESGAYLVARHLLALGRRRIAFFRHSSHQLHWVERRYSGYLRAFKESGLTPPPPFIYQYAPLDLEHEADPTNFAANARQLAVEMKKYLKNNPLDAIMLISDGETSRTAQACRLCGLNPSSDVLLAGYDNYWREGMAQTAIPFAPCVTVDKGNSEIGALMARLMLERLDGQLPSTPQQRLVAPKLILIQP